MVNYLITFYREYHLPMQHWRRVDSARTSSYANKFFQHIINALQDGCTGYAYLSGYAAMIANITQDRGMATKALELRSHAYAKLHERLSDDRADAPTSLPWTLYSFFTSAINAHDFVAAGIHGRALRDILQPEVKSGYASCDVVLLNSILWQDTQRAALTLTRPLFDLRAMTMRLISGQFFNLAWRKVVRTRLRARPLHLDESIARVFDETAYLLRLTDNHTVGHAQIDKSDLRKIAARSLVLEGQLLNLYVDRTVKLSGNSTTKQSSRVNNTAKRSSLPPPTPSTYLEICVILAGLSWLRRAGHHEGFREKSISPHQLPQRNVYDTGPQIHKAVKHALSKAGVPEMTSHPVLFLWVLYVGAVIEQRQGMIMQADLEATWFNRMFVEQAERMGLHSWSEVERVLGEILYRADISPAARHYFELFAKAPSMLRSAATTKNADKFRYWPDSIGTDSGLRVTDESAEAKTFQYLVDKDDESPVPDQGTCSFNSIVEEDEISTHMHDSIYGLFD